MALAIRMKDLVDQGEVADYADLARLAGPDNRWADHLTGCAVAVSIQGAVLPGTDSSSPARRQRMRPSELQRNKR